MSSWPASHDWKTSNSWNTSRDPDLVNDKWNELSQFSALPNPRTSLKCYYKDYWDLNLNVPFYLWTYEKSEPELGIQSAEDFKAQDDIRGSIFDIKVWMMHQNRQSRHNLRKHNPQQWLFCEKPFKFYDRLCAGDFNDSMVKPLAL